MKKLFFYTFTVLVTIMIGADYLPAQEVRWLNAGALHNWYSSSGAEPEHGLRPEQQFGLRWPAIYEFQDAQAAKSMWIGVQRFDDGINQPWQPRVIHVGPRVRGEDGVVPLDFRLVSRTEQPNVFVDGDPTFSEEIIIDEIDPNIPGDRMLVNEIQTEAGIKVIRRIHQFSQEYHDNYHVMEYELVNNTNELDVPTQTLEGVWLHHQFRYAPVRKVRFMVNNSAGWGRNTMIDRVGDGLRGGTVGEPFRAQFAWHGYHPDRETSYNNIGAPMIEPRTARSYMTTADTTGKLGAHHFVGFVTLHADRSVQDRTDDIHQPGTQGYIHSDSRLTSQNNPFDRGRMADEYDFISEGISDRHAYRVHEGGDFENQTNPPWLGTSGGFSAHKGYGPYTLAPGDTIRIVWAEAVSGLSDEMAEAIGSAFKNSKDFLTVDGDEAVIDNLEKNRWVMTSRDSLFQTFERALANFESGYQAPRPPSAPGLFEVNSGGDAISLEWDYSGDLNRVSHFEIYRAQTRVDSTYRLIHEPAELGPDTRSFEDITPVRGLDYYYYIVAVGHENDNPGTAMTPEGALRSSRYMTQTYDPARLQRPAGETMNEIAIVPNPYNRSVDDNLRLDPRGDRIAFFDVPGRADIRIYTELGHHVRTIQHRDGSGDAFWDLRTTARQLVASGVYIVVFENLDTGESVIKKLVVIL